MENNYYKQYYNEFKQWLKGKNINIYENRWQISYILRTLQLLSKYDKLQEIGFLYKNNEDIKLVLGGIGNRANLYFIQKNNTMCYTSFQGGVVYNAQGKIENDNKIIKALDQFINYGKRND